MREVKQHNAVEMRMKKRILKNILTETRPDHHIATYSNLLLFLLQVWITGTSITGTPRTHHMHKIAHHATRHPHVARKSCHHWRHLHQQPISPECHVRLSPRRLQLIERLGPSARSVRLHSSNCRLSPVSINLEHHVYPSPL